MGGLKDTTMANDTPETAAPAPTQQKPAALAAMPPPPIGDGTIDVFASGANYANAQRMAIGLAKSSIVPKAYQDNAPNCLIALELASRIRCSPMAVMQNLDVIHGNPSFRAKFLIATVNESKRFSPIRWRFQGTEGKDDWGCRAWAKDLATGEECVGPLVTIKMAKAEGWTSKTGSKWITMPEVMLMYRSGAFWQRLYCPELSLGMGTSEEAEDMSDGDGRHGSQVRQDESARALEDALLGRAREAAPTQVTDAEVVDPKTGEVTSTAPTVPEPTPTPKPADEPKAAPTPTADPRGVPGVDFPADDVPVKGGAS